MPLSEQEELELLLLLEEEEGSGGKEKGFQDILPEDMARENAKLKWYDRPRALVQGLTIGASDELGALGGAALAKANQAITGRGDQSFGEIYDDMHQQFQDERESYEKDNMGDALGLNIAGGLATGGVSALKMLPNAGKFLRTAMLSGEGAAAGALSADQGERLQGAKFGAAAAPAMAAPMKLAGGVANQLAKRRVAQDLAPEGGQRIPYHLAASQGPMRDFYQNVVGRALGGKTKLIDDTNRILSPVRANIDRLTELKSAANRTAQHELNAASGRGTALKKAMLREGAPEIDTRVVAKMEGIDSDLAGKKQALSQAKDIETDKIDAGIIDNAARKDLRVKLQNLSTNSAMDDETMRLISEGNPKQVAKTLDNWWSKNGFKWVKDKQYTVDKGIRKELLEMAEADPDSAEAFKKVLKSDGTVSGSDLMGIRNFFARPANRTADRWSAGKLNAMKENVDRVIRSGMNEGEIAKYADDLKRYGNKETYLKAVRNAGGQRQGEFTEDDLVNALRRGRVREHGAGVLQDEAEALQLAHAARKAEGKLLKRAVKNKTSQEKDTASLASKRLRKSVSRQKDVESQKLADAAEKLKTRQTSPVKRRNLSRQADIDAELAKQKQMHDQIVGLSPPSETSGLSSALTTQMLSPMPGDRGIGTRLLGGTGAAKVLASDVGQDLVAGQTGWQKLMAEKLRDTEQMREMLYRALYREGAASAGDN